MTGTATLEQRLRDRAKFRKSMIILDKVASYERSDIELDREAAAAIASLRDANKALTAEVDDWKHSNAEHAKCADQHAARAIDAENDRDRFIEGKVLAECQRDAAEAKLTEARRLIEPFAKAADSYDPRENDDHCVAWAHDFTLGHLRAFRSFLASKGASQ